MAFPSQKKIIPYTPGPGKRKWLHFQGNHMNRNERKGPFSYLTRLFPQAFSSFCKLPDISLTKSEPAKQQGH